MKIELREGLFPTQEEVAEKLRELKKKYNITKLMLIDNCGVSINTLWKLQNGYSLAPGTLLAIKQGLDKIEKKDCLF